MNNANDFSSIFEKFEDSFTPDAGTVTNAVWRDPLLISCSMYLEFATKYAGASFNKGIFHFYDNEMGPLRQKLLEDVFFDGKESPLRVFASDWLGRQYAINPENKDAKNESLVSMFELEEGKYYKIPATFVDFFEEEIFYSDDVLFQSFLHEEWVKHNKIKHLVNVSKCAGLKVPLALGGSWELNNLELVDFEIYWELTGQIIDAVT